MRLFLLFLLISLNTMLMSQEEATTENYPTVTKKSIRDFELKEGVHDVAFQLNNKKTWRAKISVPKIEADKEYALILALHWAGGHETYQEYSDCLAFPALDTLNAIIIAPSSEGLHWIHPMMETRVIHLVKKIKKYWPIQEDKMMITGYSNGAIGTWAYIQKSPKLFSVAIPMAGYYDSSTISVPTYAIHGTKDELFKVDEVEQTLKASIEKGSPIEYEFIPDFSHYMACDYMKYLEKKALVIWD